MRFAEIMNSYAAELAKGDRTHIKEFGEGCLVVLNEQADTSHFLFNDKYGAIDWERDELFSTVICKVMEGIGGYDTSRDFCNWLRRISLNEYCKEWNECRNRKTVSLDAVIAFDDDNNGITLGDILASSEDIERDYINRESFNMLGEAYDNLPENKRAAMRCCYLEGKKRKEAAAELGISEAALNNHLKRGSDKLEEFCYENDIAKDLLSDPDI